MPDGDNPRTNALIVLLATDDPAADSAGDLGSYAVLAGLPELTAELVMHGVSASRRVVRCTTPERVRTLEAQARSADTASVDRPSLNRYWRLEMPHAGIGIRDALMVRLIALSRTVSHVYPAPTWSAPDGPVAVPHDPLADKQVYLEAVAAPWAWARPGGKGQGVGVVDIETGWWLDSSDEADHPDLKERHAGLVYGGCECGQHDHGTAVLGIIGALHNGVGIIGIAPGLDRLQMSSAFDPATGTHGHVADALIAALLYSKPGDVIALEQQVLLPPDGNLPFYPAEVDNATFDALCLVAAHGRIVVEAAGNGSTGNRDISLDSLTVPYPLPNDPTFLRSFDPSDANFLDSCAILVSSCTKPPAPYTWLSPGNIGQRIDCLGIGAAVLTLGYNTYPPRSEEPGKGYSDDMMQNTSAATAIVTGLAAIVQGMRLAGGHPPLNWSEMRYLLSTYGTPLDEKSRHLACKIVPSADAIVQGKPDWF